MRRNSKIDADEEVRKRVKRKKQKEEKKKKKFNLKANSKRTFWGGDLKISGKVRVLRTEMYENSSNFGVS